MAIPPEVHSVLLSAGPGSGSLLAAAVQWQELSNQYTRTAAELSQLLAGLKASGWQGTSATHYVAAHGPYLVWLERASVDSAVTAAQHETAAAAYSSALAAMPTLTELAANRAAHVVLVATNLFGMNTIPIARNEAHYVGMWMQAADTMTVYQAITEVATATMRSTQSAPPILVPGGAAQGVQQLVPGWIVQLLTDILDFIADPYEYFLEFFERFGFSPAVAVVLAVIALQLYDFLWYPYYASYGLLLVPFFAPALSALSALGALSALRNSEPLAGSPPDPAGSSPGNQVRSHIPVGVAPAASTAPSGSAQAGNPAPSTPASATACGPPPSPGISYAVPGLPPPGVSSGPKAGTKSPDTVANPIAATAAAKAGSSPARAHRRQRNKTRAGARGYRDEFLEPTAAMPGIDAPAKSELGFHSTSGQGAGPLGFSGTTPTTASAPAGMVQLSSDSTSGTVPLLPTTWTSDTEDTPVSE